MVPSGKDPIGAFSWAGGECQSRHRMPYTVYRIPSARTVSNFTLSVDLQTGKYRTACDSQLNA
jgi:hypothetical protein